MDMWLFSQASAASAAGTVLAQAGDIPGIWWVSPIGALAALIMAFTFFKWVKGQPEGDAGMIEIAEAVRQGAMAYLVRQYKVVAVVFVLLVVVLGVISFGLKLQPTLSMLGVPFAGLLSGLCGWFGMKTATYASARTANAAKQSLNGGLTVAFRAGAVMGLVVVGFALLDVSTWFFLFKGLAIFGERPLTELTVVMLSYGMGASTQALFARVGGGIYTKAADVGADLVGKVEAGIPEDDARNPATIADNVGDNVGDVAGMGADLYESYYGSILSSMALGAAAAVGLGLSSGADAVRLTIVPMCLAGVGILCSILGIFTVKAKEGATFNQLLKSLHTGVWVASALIIAASGALLWFLLKDIQGVSWMGLWGSIISGLVAGLIIAWGTEYYTSYEHKPTKRIAEQSQTGPATVIIAGIAEGMMSTWIPLVVIVVAILAAFGFAGGTQNFLLGLFGVGIAAVGMLSTLGITLATDAYGPIADNAGGNAEMTGQPKHVRQRTDMLDSLGNTTAATGKGFAIGSAALTAMALLAAYVQVVQQQQTSQAQAWYESQSIAAPAQATAYYEGHNKWAIVGADGASKVVGGLALLSDAQKRDIDEAQQHEGARPISVALTDWDPQNKSWRARYSQQHDGHSHDVVFRMTRADQASIRDMMMYYDVTLMNPRTIGGLFMGVLLTFAFCALTMNAVGRAAYAMMNECRRQFARMREAFKASGMSESDIADPNKWPKKVTHEGIQYPQYAQCVAISTAGAQKEMIIPALLAIIVPVVVGLILGVAGVIGLLMGGLSSGFAVAIFMANAGGAWDNAKKYIEAGHLGGKGSQPHKAAVVGDTVGDPFKDTSGPSLNILIKLISIVSVVFAGLVVKYGPIIGEMIGLH